MATQHPTKAQTVLADGVDLAVTTAGDPTAPTVLLVHGYPDTRRIWDPLIPLLAEHHHVIAYDVRGMGESSAPDGPGGWSMTELLEDADSVLDAVAWGREFHLVGHDWGAMQAWAYTADPARRDRVRSLTVMSGPPLPMFGRWVQNRLRRGDLPSVVRQVLRSAYVPLLRAPALPEAVLRTFGETFRRRGGIPGSAELPADLAVSTAVNGLELYRQAGAGPEIAPGTIDTPAQVVVPTDDPYLSTALLEDTAEAADRRWIRRLSGGHWAFREHPRTVARWITEFVAHTEGGPQTRSLARARVRPERREFEDQLVLVTGAASGIGLATTRAFARRGADLVLADVDKAGLDAAVDTALGDGAPSAHTFAVDVSDREAMQEFAATVHAEHGVVDVLVNNAGIGVAGPFLDTSLEEWDRILGVNLLGVVHGCLFFGARMAERGEGGQIVNIASAAAYSPSRILPVYGTTKAGVLALSESLRLELAPQGVGVSAVCPGIINTNIARATTMVGSQDPDGARRRAASLFERRDFPPSKVAEAIVRAVERNPAVMPVAPEAHLLRLVSRTAPGLFERLAGLDLPI